MNYTEYTTLATLTADYDIYTKKALANGKKPVSIMKYVLGNL